MRRVTDLLEPVVGIGKVARHGPRGAGLRQGEDQLGDLRPPGPGGRSIQQKDEKVQKRDAGAGLPGTASNVAPATGGASANVTENSEKKETTTNFEITKTVSATDKATGTVKRVTLAVIVDHMSAWDKDAKGEPVQTTARSADELKKIRDQVSAAVGIQHL